MCGILGGLGDYQLSPEKIKTALQKLEKRGPDGEGLMLGDDFFLGHRRLSIIDLSTGAQPIASSDNRYTIIFNGEIYNYQKIKSLAGDYDFKTSSDTEVILALYIKHGEKVLDLLEGMFAFVIYDAQEKSVFIARDSFGIKPLFYYFDGQKIYFASEIKAILPLLDEKLHIDKQSVCDYFALKYIPAPATIYEEIKKLPAGNYLTAKITGNKIEINIQKYWQPVYRPNNELVNLENLKKLFLDSVQDHLIADVPVGAFLSGGIDSSAIVWAISELGIKPKTFTVNFLDVKNDPDVICSRLVAEKFKTDHCEIQVKGDDYLEEAEKIFSYLDEPFADPALISNHYVSRATSEKIKVALSGDGADELFFGYQTYQKISDKNWIYSLFNPNWKMEKFFNYNQTDNTQLLGPDQPNLPKLKKFNDLRAKLRLTDLQQNIPDYYLCKADIASMMNSLEVRVPFLSRPLVEEILKIDVKKHYNEGVGKYILKQIVKDVLPLEILNRPKKGFSRPVNILLTPENLNFIKTTLSACDFFNQVFLNNLINKNKDGRLLYRLLVFAKWFKNNNAHIAL